jgi:hypothetical protein
MAPACHVRVVLSCNISWKALNRCLQVWGYLVAASLLDADMYSGLAWEPELIDVGEDSLRTIGEDTPGGEKDTLQGTS